METERIKIKIIYNNLNNIKNFIFFILYNICVIVCFKITTWTRVTYQIKYGLIESKCATCADNFKYCNSHTAHLYGLAEEQRRIRVVYRGYGE